MPEHEIKVLSDNIVNKIAAGEIIERPSAVVKELVENSLDAGAKNITVRFSKGGKFSIIVEDDGLGMSRNDALLSLERHATSKLEDIRDFNDLRTFGFRGEAIPSIASISKFTMLTCKKGCENGTEISIDGGKIVEIKDYIKFIGTKVSVENLFFNIPARRKFMKSDETESLHIISLIKNMALAEAGVNFTLFQNGSQIFSSPDLCSCGDRANAIFGHKEKFINFEYSMDGVILFGTICDPEYGDICRKNITIFVNNRIVKNDVITSALCQNLQGIFPDHRGILAYIFLQIMPESIDVNVHPMKKEVRFKNELQIRELVARAMEQLFKNKQHKLACINFYPVQSTVLKNIKQPDDYRNVSQPIRNSIAHASFNKDYERGKIFSVEQPSFSIQSDDRCLREWSFIGLTSTKLAIFESKTGIIFFNIKPAVRRVIYERITADSYNATAQKLLFPIEFSLTQEEQYRLREVLPVLEKHGFSIYQSGEHDYKIDGIPDWLSCEAAEMALRSAIFDDKFGDKSSSKDLEKALSKKISKFSKSENYRSQHDIEALCDRLFECKNHLMCPEGNVIFFEVTNFEIESRF